MTIVACVTAKGLRHSVLSELGIEWLREWDLNPRHPAYETGALAAELPRYNNWNTMPAVRLVPGALPASSLVRFPIVPRRYAPGYDRRRD